MGSGQHPGAEWFREMADDSQLVFFVVRVQPDLVMEYVNRAGETLLGIPHTDGITEIETFLAGLAPMDAARANEVLALEPGQSADVELQWTHPDGRLLTTRSWVRSRRRDDGSVVLEGTVRDISASLNDRLALAHSEERHRLLAENAWDVIWTMDLDGTITYVSPAVERVRGITPTEAMNQTLEEIHPPESAARVVDYCQRLFAAIEAGEEPPTFRGEQEYYRKDGSIMVGELQVIPHVDREGRVVEILGVTRDISERKTFEAELTRLAVTDALTGVWNRRHAEQLLAADLIDAQRHGPSLSLLMIDLDHFKQVNDTLGHEVGDRVLVEITRRMGQRLRTTDMLARWGGEEFVILLRFCGQDDARKIAESLRLVVADTPIDPAGQVTISLGVAQLREDDDLTSWLGRADRALYEAKQSGRNTVRP